MHARILIRAPIAAVLLLAIVTGCGQRIDFNIFRPEASQAYFSTWMCGFNFDGKAREVRLRIELNVTKPLPRDGLLIVQFENPIKPGDPFVISRKLTGEEKTLVFTSPPLFEIRPRSYEIVALLYSTADKSALLATHAQVCESPFDQRDLGAPFR